jgi:hypothetical protein
VYINLAVLYCLLLPSFLFLYIKMYKWPRAHRGKLLMAEAFIYSVRVDDIYTDEWSALLFESLFSDLPETPHKTRRNIGREVETDDERVAFLLMHTGSAPARRHLLLSAFEWLFAFSTRKIIDSEIR